MDWNEQTQDTGTHDSGDAAEAGFHCVLCNKAYSRRDLRDRHRRRCARTFGQTRASKRKSCETCVQMKLRCSLARPACTRCVQMGNVCHYPSSSLSTTSPAQGGYQYSGSEQVSPIAVNILGPVSAGLSQGPVVPVPAITLPGDVSNTASNFEGIWSSVFNDSGFLSLDGSNFLDPASGFMDGFSLSFPSSSSGTSNHDAPAAQDHVEAHGTDDTSMFANNFMPDLSHTALQDTSSLSQELFSIFHNYLKSMVQRAFWSPFIHHQLYRCSQGGMAEPLGIALACVSAYSSAVESSFNFVDNMVNSQREQLVHDFHLYSDRPETCLAALHAVCMYQILGLFGQKSVEGIGSGQSTPSKPGYDRHREDLGKPAELYSSFLLKMTRLFCRQHQRALGQNESGWSDWKFTESLRRNVFLVHMINILGAKARSLHHHYFEPLNDAKILQMPLPAPESMWRACSDPEWRVARENANMASTTLDTLQGLLDLDRTGHLNVTLLPPLTRMIFACHKIRPNLVYDEEG